MFTTGAPRRTQRVSSLGTKRNANSTPWEKLPFAFPLQTRRHARAYRARRSRTPRRRAKHASHEEEQSFLAVYFA